MRLSRTPSGADRSNRRCVAACVTSLTSLLSSWLSWRWQAVVICLFNRIYLSLSGQRGGIVNRGTLVTGDWGSRLFLHSRYIGVVKQHSESPPALWLNLHSELIGCSTKPEIPYRRQWSPLVVYNIYTCVWQVVAVNISICTWHRTFSCVHALHPYVWKYTDSSTLMNFASYLNAAF